MQFKLIPTSIYYPTLLKSVVKVKKSILVQTLYLDFSAGQVRRIFHQIKTSQVVLKLFLVDDLSRRWFFEPKSGLTRVNKASKFGIRIFFTNQAKIWQRLLLPYFFRNHIKLVIVDNQAFFGGINFAFKEEQYQDVMIQVTDCALVLALKLIFFWSLKGKIKSRRFQISNQSQFLVDGFSGRIILDEVLSQLKQAQRSIRFVSQFPPDVKVLRVLASAKLKGVDVKLILPGENQFNFLFKVLHLIGLWRLYLSKLKHDVVLLDQMIHAKMIVIDDKLAVVGSHNFNFLTEVARSNELVLVTTDINFVRQCLLFLDKLKEQA